MKIFSAFMLSILLVAFLVQIRGDDDQPEEKDPWDKSTDKYLNRDENSNQNMNVDVTEESESEVHTEKKGKVGGKNSTEKDEDKQEEEERVDKETKQQFEDAVDETDPAENIQAQLNKESKNKSIKSKKSKKSKKKKIKQHSKHIRGHKKQHLEKKQFNYHGDFYPGSLWEYPYPYYHPQYGCGAPVDCPCVQGGEGPPVEAKEDEPAEEPEPPKPPPPKAPKTKKKQLVPEHYYGPPSAGWGGFQPGHTGGGWGAPYWYKKRSHTHRQLIPNHYYGPPSAGWGGFQPGHTGGGWGAPYWYKKKRSHTHRQLIPNHYYGPPSAGWGGFQPGHTGGGWGAPYWYKKKRSHTHRQLIPNHYYGPPSAGWGGFQPGHTGGGWGAPYWYKKRSHTHRQLIPNHYYGPPSAGWGGFQPGHTGGGWGAPYWYKSKVVKPKTKARKGERKFVVAGNDPHGLGLSGNDGWDSGSGAGYGHSWGRPNVYGTGPLAHHYGGPEDIDYKAWHGPDSFGSRGWGGHGWLADYGWMHGDEHERGFGSGFAGWGNAGGDMSHLDEKIGEGDAEGGMEGFAHGNHGGKGHTGHNSDFQGIGYNLAAHGSKTKSKSKVPVTQNVVIDFDKAKNEQPIQVKHEEMKYTPGKVNGIHMLPKNEFNIAKSSKKTVRTRAKNEKPVTQ